MPALDVISRLTKDLKEASVTLSINEARYLVDAYYIIQNNRKTADNQNKALTESGEPHAVLQWLFDQNRVLESQIKRALDAWTDASEIGIWAKSIVGIGPVISAGLLAHIDITKAPTVGHIWRFAGLDPTSKWNKGEKRPWNADLKVLAWKIGECFVKVCNNENDFYGKIYAQRKSLEIDRNELGMFKQQAEDKLRNFKIGKGTDARMWYEQGKLPPAHIHARARRYAVKLFLAHYHYVAYQVTYNMEPPKPYVISILGHVDMIYPPNWSRRISER